MKCLVQCFPLVLDKIITKQIVSCLPDEHDISKLDRIFFQVTITFNNNKNLLCYGSKVVNASSINVKKATDKQIDVL